MDPAQESESMWQEFDLGPDYHTPVEDDMSAGVLYMKSIPVPLGLVRVLRCGCTPDHHLAWGHVGS